MILQAENIIKIYKTASEQISVLTGTNFVVSKNEIVSIMGPSGSGKSTLLHLLGTLDKPTSGKLLIDGEDIDGKGDLSGLRSKKIGFIFQHHYLLPEFTVLENLLIPQALIGREDQTAKVRAEDLLSRMDLINRKNHYPSQISGGERQRIAVLRALVNSPKIVLADEPTGNLDSGNRDKLLSLIMNLHKTENLAFIIATHDDKVAGIADRILFLEEGKLIQN